MNNLVLEEYINNILDKNQVNNTKLLFKSIDTYKDIIIDFKNKKMVDFMEYYINYVLDNYYNKKEYSNNSILYLLKGLVHFLEISEILLKYDIDLDNRKKLYKYTTSNNGDKIIKNKDVKKSKSLELLLLSPLELGSDDFFVV